MPQAPLSGVPTTVFHPRRFHSADPWHRRFVAAEFSLTALERSTVDANARTGGRRDQIVQRAHRTLSFQLSGAQIGISITTLITRISC